MKKYFAIAALAFIAIGASAQDQNVTPKEKFDRLKKELDLSEAQSEQLIQIMNNRKKEHEERAAEIQKERKEKQEQRAAEREKYRSQLREVLNEEQMEKFEQIMKERRENAVDRRKHHRKEGLRHRPEH